MAAGRNVKSKGRLSLFCAVTEERQSVLLQVCAKVQLASLDCFIYDEGHPRRLLCAIILCHDTKANSWPWIPVWPKPERIPDSSSGTLQRRAAHLTLWASVTLPVLLSAFAARCMAGISSRQQEQSELMCVSGPFGVKLQALFAAKGTMVFLFKGSTSESLSELRRKVRVKRWGGAGSGYLTCMEPMSSGKCGIRAISCAG